VCGLRPDKSSSLQTLGKKHSPSPLHHRIFTRSPLGHGTQQLPGKRILEKLRLYKAASPSNPLRMSSAGGEPHFTPPAVRSSLDQKIDEARERFTVHQPTHYDAVTVAQLDLDHFTGLLWLRSTQAWRFRDSSLVATRRVLTVTAASWLPLQQLVALVIRR